MRHRPERRSLRLALTAVLGVGQAVGPVTRADAQPARHAVGAAVRRSALGPVDRERMARQAGPRGGARARRVALHAVVGGLAGGAVGLVAAYVGTHRARVKDHSEDAIAYIVLVPSGAAIGTVVGGVVGLIRTR